jgi:hypothetical protein
MSRMLYPRLLAKTAETIKTKFWQATKNAEMLKLKLFQQFWCHLSYDIQTFTVLQIFISVLVI